VAFIWDEKKAATNLRKHGIEFPFAVRVFQSAVQAEWIDDREDYGEERWNIVGFVDGLALLVTYTLRGEDIRILSARRTTKYEQEKYWRG
jgi:uncharacterized DUF497 family protein